MIKQTTSNRTKAKVPAEPAAQPIPETAPVATPKGSTRMSPLAVGLVVVVLVAAVLLILKNGVMKPAEVQTPGPAQSAGSNQPVPTASQEEIQALIAKVATHISIKQDEAPTVATIQNADMLRAQNPVFYKDAQIGDRLLIWSDKAVLYSPASDKVLAVLPISLPPNASSTSTQATETAQYAQNVIVEIRNGSGVAGLGRMFSTKLKDAGFPHILTPTDAKSKTPYPNSIIIGSATATEAIAKLQQLTGAVIKELPASEAPMKGDVLLILGVDAKQ